MVPDPEPTCFKPVAVPNPCWFLFQAGFAVSGRCISNSAPPPMQFHYQASSNLVPVISKHTVRAGFRSIASNLGIISHKLSRASGVGFQFSFEFGSFILYAILTLVACRDGGVEREGVTIP